MSGKYLGVYRGEVANNLDPLLKGRVQVSVPAVFGDGKLAWAEVCVPFAGNGVGGFAVPPVGANCWVLFEDGDADYPVLAGCFWGNGESPAPGMPQVKMFKSDAVTVTVSDVAGAGGLTVEVGSPVASTPVKITLGAQGIELTAGSSSIKLDGVSVSINSDALKVT